MFISQYPTKIKNRQWLFNVLERPKTMPAYSLGINRFLIALIFINVFAATLETVPKYALMYDSVFLYIERLSISVFTVEFFLRLWVSIEAPEINKRWHYFFTINALIDLVSIVPFYLSLLLGLDLKVFVILRLLRLLKLVRYFEPLSVLWTALKAEFSSFISALFILFILVMLASAGIYLLEHEVQPEVFGNIPQAMWWSVVTLTTMGYGDVVPVTAQGKVFASIMTIFSIGTVALPAGMLASRFSDELNKRKESFKDLAMLEQKQGQLSEQSQAFLEQSRKDMSLTEQEATELIKYVCTKSKGICPHCGQQLKKGEDS